MPNTYTITSNPSWKRSQPKQVTSATFADVLINIDRAYQLQQDRNVLMVKVPAQAEWLANPANASHPEVMQREIIWQRNTVDLETAFVAYAALLDQIELWITFLPQQEQIQARDGLAAKLGNISIEERCPF